ncbi:hypothetical protein CTEN210_04076 [Chaetoceros tenuissimus]|uniref:Uncharacterized protein n=1 Tax=Chaetoceros tenuissimus TaxID=426638 RepID=A0AAD3CMG4_9STRA|nr:hypothetical protein CTEN210_04076 [Chaetoceros tenuissimus]
MPDIEIGDDDIVNKIGTLGNYESAMWCQKQFSCLCFESYSSSIARSGNIQLFKHLEQTFVNFDSFEGAALGGNIEMLEYLYQKQYHLDEETCAESLRNIDKDQALKVLKWLREHDCPWDEKTCSSAAENDNMKALKWARNNGCPWNEETFASAAKNGNIKILEYCLDNGCPMDARACEKAVKNKNDLKALEILKWLRRHSCPWDGRTYHSAYYSKNFFCFIFAHKNGCPRGGPIWSLNLKQIIGSEDTTLFERFLQDYEKLEYYRFADIFRSSAPNSLITEKLKLLRNYGYEWTADFCRMATDVDNLKLLQWLRCHQCPWDVKTCNSAVKRGHLQLCA